MTAYGLVIPTEQRCQESLPSSRARGTALGGGGGLLLSNFNVTLKSLSHGEGWGKTGSWYQLPLAFYAFQLNAPEWSVEYIR